MQGQIGELFRPDSGWGRVFFRVKETGVPVNAFMLFHLTEAARSRMKDASRTAIWMIPVLTAGRITPDMPPGNYISFLDLFLEPGMTLPDVSRHFREKISDGAHWGTAFALRLNLLFGEKGMAKMIEAIDRRGRRTGIFSSVGSWRPKANGESWGGIPPVHPALPFGAGSVTWGGKLSLSLQYHPSITVEKEYAREMLEDWRTRLLSKVDS